MREFRAVPTASSRRLRGTCRNCGCVCEKEPGWPWLHIDTSSEICEPELVEDNTAARAEADRRRVEGGSHG